MPANGGVRKRKKGPPGPAPGVKTGPMPNPKGRPKGYRPANPKPVARGPPAMPFSTALRLTLAPGQSSPAPALVTAALAATSVRWTVENGTDTSQVDAADCAFVAAARALTNERVLMVHDLPAGAAPPTEAEWASRAGMDGTTALTDAINSGRAARTALLARHQEALEKAVGRHCHGRFSFRKEELLVEGTLGLVRAAERYGADGAATGLTFAEFSRIWVRAGVNAWLKRQSQSPGSGRERRSTGGRVPRSQKAAAPVGPMGGRPATGPGGALSPVDQAMFQSELDAAMDVVLTSRERLCLRLRFGLDDGVHRSTREVAELIGISREGVRKVCLNACRKLGDSRQGRALLAYVPAPAVPTEREAELAKAEAASRAKPATKEVVVVS